MSNISTVVIPDELVMNKIYFIRDQKVMLDEDLAELYSVETKRLNEQVKRNFERFPGDFMFQLNEIEFNDLKTQNTTSNWEGERKLLFAFTEPGILMLPSVLNNKQTIKVSIQIMSIYTKIRELLLAHKDVFIKVKQVEKKLIKQDEKIELLFNYLNKFIEKEDNQELKLDLKLRRTVKTSSPPCVRDNSTLCFVASLLQLRLTY